MELQFKGGNCFKLVTKKATLVIDDNLKDLGLSQAGKKADIQLFTNPDFKKSATDEGFTIDGPGEYEISGISVHGIPARSHMEENGNKTATMYRVNANGIAVLFTGHIYPELKDVELEEIGVIDVVVIPVGGNGYTMDSIGAAKIVKAVEPKIVIPSHYKDTGVKYEVEQNEVLQFINEIGSEPQTEDKLKLRAGTLGEVLTVYQLNRS